MDWIGLDCVALHCVALVAVEGINDKQSFAEAQESRAVKSTFAKTGSHILSESIIAIYYLFRCCFFFVHIHFSNHGLCFQCYSYPYSMQFNHIHHKSAMLATQLNHLILNKEITRHTILRLNKVVCNQLVDKRLADKVNQTRLHFLSPDSYLFKSQRSKSPGSLFSWMSLP